MRLAKPRGVPVEELRAALGIAHLHGDGEGLTWSPAEWARLWSRLTPVMQHVVYGLVLTNQTQTAIAADLGISRGSVDAAFRRAIDRIRDLLPH